MFQFKTSVPAGHDCGAHAAQETAAISGFIGGERRSEHRRRVLKVARVVLPGKLTAYDATVRDITASGARIRAGEYTRLPEAFELQVRDEKYPRMARVAWRSGADAGLVFTR
jgi:hypothetical protein